MNAIERRWNTRFGSWVRGYGVNHLVSELGRSGTPATSFAVYKWVSGRHVPDPSRAVAITQISGGALSLEDVYGHRAEVAKNG